MKKKTILYDNDKLNIPSKSKNRFWKHLGIYALSFLVLTIIGLAFFWQYMKSYELSRPENVMNEYVTTINDEKVRALMVDNEKISTSEFEDKEAILQQYYFAYLKNEPYKFRKMPGEYTDTNPVYLLHSSDTDLCKVVLTSKGDNTAGYGFNLWQIQSFEILDSILAPESRTLSITVPLNTDIYLNSIKVEDKYIVDSNVPYEGFTEIIHPFDIHPTGKRYEIPNIYLKETVQAQDTNGKIVTLKQEQNEYSYSLVISKATSYSITAPLDTKTYVNGHLLTSEYLQSNTTIYPILEDLQAYMQMPILNTYTIENLYFEPVIESYTEEGAALSKEANNNAIIFRYPASEVLKTKHEVSVMEFAKTYINFTTNATGDVFGYFSVLRTHLIENNVLYERLKSAMPSLWWVKGSSLIYKYLTVSDFAPISETCFTCKMSFGVTNKTYYETRELEDSFDLVYILYNGKWRVADMLSD